MRLNTFHLMHFDALNPEGPLLHTLRCSRIPYAVRRPTNGVQTDTDVFAGATDTGASCDIGWALIDSVLRSVGANNRLAYESWILT
jgi:hypothetical protein